MNSILFFGEDQRARELADVVAGLFIVKTASVTEQSHRRAAGDHDYLVVDGRDYQLEDIDTIRAESSDTNVITYLVPDSHDCVDRFDHDPTVEIISCDFVEFAKRLEKRELYRDAMSDYFEGVHHDIIDEDHESDTHHAEQIAAQVVDFFDTVDYQTEFAHIELQSKRRSKP